MAEQDESRNDNHVSDDPIIVTGETKPSHANGVSTADAGARSTRFSQQVDELKAAVKRLETFATKEAKRVRELAPVAEERVKKNLWVSLLMALGLGLVLGLFLGTSRRRGD